jgi:hypothetical protein
MKRWIVTALLIGSFVMVFWLLIDRQARRTYQAYVALDRYGPPSVMDPPWQGPDLVVLYRTGRYGVVCYDVIRSKDLHDHLSAKNGQLVTVEYETFRDFGKVRGYIVRSVDGMTRADGSLTGGAGVIASKRADGSFSGGQSDCW